MTDQEFLRSGAGKVPAAWIGDTMDFEWGAKSKILYNACWKAVDNRAFTIQRESYCNTMSEAAALRKLPPIGRDTAVYQQLEPKRKEIRLARIAPAEAPNAPIEISLQVVSLLDNVHYTALSYCWNSLEGKDCVILSGHQTTVTRNLWEALRQLRLEEFNTFIWIDALCINQNDIQERSTQVALMRELYNKARHVRTWLGPATPQSKAGFDFMQYILSSPDVDISKGKISGPHNSTADFLALGQIFRNPYWSRRWVTQELHFARSISIHCGEFGTAARAGGDDGIFPLITRFTDKCLNIAVRNLYERGSFFNVVLEETSAVTSALGKLIDPKRARNVAQLNNFFRVSATDEHDYVYGLIGLLPDAMGIVPNYELDAKEVFTDFAFRFMKSYDGRLLHLAGHSSDDIPSWVPDLRKQLKQELGPFEGFRGSLPVSILNANSHMYEASAGTIWDVRDRIGGTLILAGLVLDEIVAIGENMVVSENGQGRLSDTINLYAKWQMLVQDLIKNGSLADKPISCQTEFQVVIDFTMTICAELSPDLDNPTHEMHRITRSEFEELLCYLFFRKPDGGLIDGIDIDRVEERMRWLDLLASRNTFFVTANGRMGLCPGIVCVGDRICIFAGSPTPHRLRPVARNRSDKYVYQSCTYVQGELRCINRLTSGCN